MRRLARWLSFLSLTVPLAGAAYAQSGVGLELEDVVDNRFGGSIQSGSLELRVKLKGTGLDRATAARIVVKDARDDRGTLLSEAGSEPDFEARDVNSGAIHFTVNNPARAASSVRIKGNIELYGPSRDPNAVVTVAKALSHPDAPVASKVLKAAKIDVKLLSPAGYQATVQKRKLEEKDIAQIRAEGKAHGASDKEIEAVIGLAKAMESMDADVPEGGIFLSGSKGDFDRIYRVEVLGADGKPLDMTERSLSTRGDSSVMTLKPSTPPPPAASLQFFVLTQKSRVAFPFELNVQLP
jgi:hypothetical protein